ncbi:DUF397 domain-containing protein [Streptomyces sp. NPDC053048]|uniref:DUF397 domain-containing protein n=1 Tax=Streptomyces sp. NPDC053048 TaxID=3365694 RepID=UPI0037D5F499
MMTTVDPTGTEWRKSSYSNGGDANCVEVADNIPSVVRIRDSKTLDGPVLMLAASTWSTFVATLRR